MKKKKAWPRVLVAAVVVALCVGVLLTMGQKNTARYAEAETKTGSLTTYYSFTGALEARRTQTFSAQQADTVKELYVQAGDAVKKNDRLVRLSSGETLRSDIAGEVTDVSVSVDDAVVPGAPLMTVADLDNLEVKIKVDEYDVAAMKPGASVSLHVSALDLDTEGTVTGLNKLATQAQNSTYYTATVSIKAEEGMLPGMEVGVKLLKAQVKDAVLLSADALKFDEENTPYVLLMDDKNQIRAQNVTTGITDGRFVEIKSGLSAGTTVYYTDNSFEDIYSLMQSRRSGQ